MSMWNLSEECKVGFLSKNQPIVNNHFNGTKNRNYMTTSVDTENIFGVHVSGGDIQWHIYFEKYFGSF